MRAWWKRIALVAGMMALALVIYFAGVDLKECGRRMLEIPPTGLAALFAIQFAICANFILKNVWLLSLCGFHARISSVAHYFFASSFAHNTVPGKMGYPIMAWLLKRFEKIPIAVSVTILSLDSLCGFGFTVCIALTGAATFFREFHRSALGAMICLLAAALAVGLALRFGSKESHPRLAGYLANARQNLDKFRAPRLLPLLFFYVINALLTGLGLRMMISFWGHSVDLPRLIAADALAFVLGAISMVPMGLGIQDISMLHFLRGFGLEPEIAVNVITLQRATYLLPVLALGLIASMRLGFGTMKALDEETD